ncbi:MAG: 23S rRNA (uracil(1939)-C(5))-methyltransferase RlmD, partial [Chitinophagaceae bacterium]|nr:23S rRNA (uracil(1939)-C(5))-methyltransferase RlmD [Chitinophagaceae bacterium]
MRKKKPNIIVENVLVEDYAAEGKSISHVDGKAIFIENCIPGDIVDVQLTKNKKDWAEGFPVLFKKYSADRVPAFCTHFGVCGGCRWQTLPYEKQLYYKQKQVTDNLQRIAKIPLPPTSPIIGCEQTTLYRNKLEYTFSAKQFIPADELKTNPSLLLHQENKGAAGFHAKGFFEKVVAIDTCHLQAEPTNKMRKAVADFARKNQLPFYDIRNHTGWLRTMQVRNTSTGEWMLNIVFGYEEEKMRKQLLDMLLEQFPEITTLLYTINPKHNDSIYDLTPVVYSGAGYIVEKLEAFRFKISAKSFFQTNTKQAERLYRVARNFAQLDGTQILYDLYCGTGSIGIFAGNAAKKIIGVETIAEAIEDAKENAKLNNIQHAFFYTGDVVKVCNDAFFEQHGKPDVIITDPPRAGMQEKLIKKLLDI